MIFFLKVHLIFAFRMTWKMNVFCVVCIKMSILSYHYAQQTAYPFVMFFSHLKI